MTDDIGEHSPLGDMILRGTLEVLTGNPEFDSELLAEIKRLAAEQRLSSWEAVVKALSDRGEQ